MTSPYPSPRHPSPPSAWHLSSVQGSSRSLMFMQSLYTDLPGLAFGVMAQLSDLDDPNAAQAVPLVVRRHMCVCMLACACVCMRVCMVVGCVCVVVGGACMDLPHLVHA